MASQQVTEPLPSGTVTFLFTDIEGSTRRWETDPDAMRRDLAAHDDVLRSVVETSGGHVFKHTGDGMCAAFRRAGDAVRAATQAQLELALPVRMGIATGQVEAQGDDYFGPTLNRVARVMAAGHGGQVLIAETTAAQLEDVDLVDLGPRRLRDLSEPIRIFQLRADGLGTDFPPVRTLDGVPGNLPVQTSSFVGRDREIADLATSVARHRLVTLLGVGGVGKTRLALHVAAEVTTDFPDGVWLVELASVSDPAAVPDAVATALDVAARAGLSVTDSVTSALSGRRLLIILDNCEHVLDAARRLTEAVLESTSTVSILATSRESLGIGAEHTWPVPPLDVTGGRASAAVALFVERARAATGTFTLDAAGDLDAVTEICTRLDGIALAIELAAARTVSMSPTEVRDRLDDRFRLLSDGRRRVERHQTLLQTVQWSHDLLDDDERTVLGCCSVFADGFDLAAITAVSGSDDDLTVLDLVDSLVRKSLVQVEQVHGRTRYGMLETIRQFGEARCTESGTLDEVRDRHARWYAEQTAVIWELWDGPRQRTALDWVDIELANLRLAFRWAADRGALDDATTIAAHAPILSWPLQRFEPVSWADELLPSAIDADVAQLPRLYVAASLCLYLGRPEVGVERAQQAARLENLGRYDAFADGWSGILEALANLFGGRIERRVEICTDLAARTRFARVVGLCGLTWALPAVGRADEARELADRTLEVATVYGNPFWIGWAYGGVGRAFADTDPIRALQALRDGLDYADEHRLPFWVANLAQDAARLEAVHGEIDRALTLFDRSIDAFHRAGNVAFLAATFASLSVFFDRIGWSETAATIYGSSTRQASIRLVPELVDAVDNLREVLGADRFDAAVAAGASRELVDAVRYAHAEVRRAGVELAAGDRLPADGEFAAGGDAS